MAYNFHTSPFHISTQNPLLYSIAHVPIIKRDHTFSSLFLSREIYCHSNIENDILLWKSLINRLQPERATYKTGEFADEDTTYVPFIRAGRRRICDRIRKAPSPRLNAPRKWRLSTTKAEGFTARFDKREEILSLTFYIYGDACLLSIQPSISIRQITASALYSLNGAVNFSRLFFWGKGP